MCEHVALMYRMAVAVSYTLFSACFDYVLTGCVTVPFSVYSLTTLSQVALQFSLQFDHALTDCITVCLFFSLQFD